jgi:predicted PurR-regulated permease PerM
MDQTGPFSTIGMASRLAIRVVLLTVGIVVFLLIAWLGRVVVMLLFASGVLAVLLSAVVEWVTTKLKIRCGFTFALLLGAGFVLVFLTFWIRGPSIIEQFTDLQTDLPQAGTLFWNA